METSCLKRGWVSSPVLFFLFASLLNAQTKIWNGNGASNLASLGSNWSPAGAPALGDDALFDGTSTNPCSIDYAMEVNNFQSNSNSTVVITLADGLTVDKDFILSSGTFHAGSSTVTVSGNWTIGAGAVFDAQTSQVNFSGPNNCTLTGSTTFYSLASSGSLKNIFFTAGSTTTVTNSLYFGPNVSLQSTAGGNSWYLIFTGNAVTLTTLFASDSDASGGQMLFADAASTDGGNNHNWMFFSDPPGPVENLADSTGFQISVTWTAPPGGANVYEVHASSAGPLTASNIGPATLMQTLTSNATTQDPFSASLTGLIPDVGYYVAVRSRRNTNPAWSDVVGAGPATSGIFLMRESMSLSTDMSHPVIKVADFNLDGVSNLAAGYYEDIAMAGTVGSLVKLRVYRWDPSTSRFVNVLDQAEPGTNPMIEWVDANNDGLLDLFYSDSNTSQLWINKGAGIQIPAFQADTTGLSSSMQPFENGMVAAGDYNGDGRMDLAVVGQLNSQDTPTVRLFVHGAGGYDDGSTVLDQTEVDNGSIAWGDANNDGYMDLLVSGGTASNPVLMVLRNLGDGTFDRPWSTNGLSAGAVAWGDFDQDGKLDFAVLGKSAGSGAPQLVIYRNTTQNPGDAPSFNQSFTLSPGLSSGDNQMGSLAWGDVNNDGWLDLLVMGSDGTTPRMVLFLNKGNHSDPTTWEQVEPMGAGQGLQWGSLAFGDFDGDGAGHQGDLDYVAAGYDGQSVRAIVFENQFVSNGSNIYNHRPAAPTKLSSSIARNKLTMSWTAPAGETSTVDEMMFQIQVGSTNFSVNPATYNVSGVHGSPLMGNYLNARLPTGDRGVTVQLDDGATYYWRVRAIDAGFSQGPYAVQGPVYIPPLPPNDITDLAAVTGAQVSLTWTAPSARGDGVDPVNGYELYDSTYSSPDPSNLSSYQWSKLNVSIPVLSPGLQQELTVTGLIPFQNYWFAMRAYNTLAFAVHAGSASAVAGHYQFIDYRIPISSDTSNGSIAWGDLNNDGYQDFVIAGTHGTVDTRIYLYNPATKNFDLTQTLSEQMEDASVALGDYNNDGYLDLAIRGRLLPNSTTSDRVLIYRNRAGASPAANIFASPIDSRVSIDPNFDSGTWGQIRWADYNSDGSQDVIVLGSLTGVVALRNDPVTHNFSTVLLTTETANTTGGSMAFADVNGDGALDMAVVTSNDTALLINDGKGNFSKQWQIEGLTGGEVAWGDYNNDGFWDLAVSGKTGGSNPQTELKIFAGDGTANYNNHPVVLSTAVYSGSQLNGMMAWADLNNDGYPELIVSGETNGPTDPKRFLIYSNLCATTPDTFQVLENPFGKDYGLYSGSLAVADFDNDGDDDLAVMGLLSTASGADAPRLALLENLQVPFGAGRIPWGPPANSTATFNAATGLVTFQWNPPAVPAGYAANLNKGLSYNFGITNQNTGQVVVSTAFGTPLMGNYLTHGPGPVTWAARLLDANTYYWQVQGVDTALQTTPFLVSSVTVPVIPPAVITDLAATQGAQVRLTWTAPGEDGHTGTVTKYRIYYASNSFNASTDPGVSLMSINAVTANPPFVPGGQTETRNVTGLVPDLQYYFRVIAEDRNAASAAALSNIASSSSTHFGSIPFDGFVGFSAGGIALGNLNPGTDSRMDIAVNGVPANGTKFNALFQQTGNSFNQANIGDSLKDGAITLVDIDRNGSLDALVSGTDGNGNPATRLYLNSNGSFSLSNATFPAISRGAFAVGDINNDGDLDVVAVGAGLSGVQLFENVMLASGSYRIETSRKLFNVSFATGAAVAIADINGDGTLGMAVAGFDGTHARLMILTQKNGTFSIFNEPLGSADGYTNCSLAWADVNLDGKWDLVVMGQRQAGNSEIGVFERTSSNSTPFVFHPFSLPTNNQSLYSGGAGSGSLAVGDINNAGHDQVQISVSIHVHESHARIQ